ncbi:hypothetical protein MKEN_00918000 [Mycena kentingensis (nom. inval.)]|nr:hypothetical protein MKEN_00918000 [Mycena kentingensis (nom. inval.)]
MSLPIELVHQILRHLYYENALLAPSYDNLLNASLVCKPWSPYSRALLYRKVTSKVNGAFLASTHDPTLLASVRSFSLELTGVLALKKLLQWLPGLYELVVDAKILLLSQNERADLAATIASSDVNLRSLHLAACSSQSPILFQLLSLFPTVEFLTLGVEITPVVVPSGWTMPCSLYELKCYRAPASLVLTSLLSASAHTLRILELRELPSITMPQELAPFCGGIQSLRLMRFNRETAKILAKCTNLVELVLFNVPSVIELPALPASLEHLAILIQTFTIPVQLELVVKRVEPLQNLRLITYVGDDAHVPELRALCRRKGCELAWEMKKLWIHDDPIKTTHFPRKPSVRCLRRAPFSSSAPSAADAEPAAVDPAPPEKPPRRIAPKTKWYNPADSDFTYIPPTAPQLSQKHGLYGFFRRKADPSLKRDDRFETFTDPNERFDGREWRPSELRLKSFKDLHTLWYVLLRERNLLATQRDEMRRMGLWGLSQPPFRVNRTNAAKCRKSMARIKQIMNERRLAYEGAVELAEAQKEGATNAAILAARAKEENAERHRQHMEDLRTGAVKKSTVTARAGVKVRARKTEARMNRALSEKKQKTKARWTRAEKQERKRVLQTV